MGPIQAAWAAIGSLWTAIIVPAATALGAAIGAISAPVWVVIGIIAALIAAGVALYTHWEQVVVFAQNMWTKIQSIFAYSTALVAGIFIAVFDKMGIDIVGIFEKLTLGLQIAWAAIKVMAQMGLEWISGAFKSALTPISAAWDVLW